MSRPATLRDVIFKRLLLLVTGGLLAVMAAVVGLIVLPLHERLTASEFTRVADLVENTLRETVELPSQILPSAAEWLAGQKAPFDDTQAAERYFKPLLSHVRNISSIVIGNEEGRGWMLLRLPDGRWRSRSTDLPGTGSEHLIVEEDVAGNRSEHWQTLDYDARSRPWYEGAVRPGTVRYWTPPYTFYTTGQPGITVSQAVSLSDGSQGAIGLDILLAELSTRTREARIGASGSTLVLTEGELVLALPRRPDHIAESDWLGTLMLPASALGQPSINDALSLWRQAGRTRFSASRFNSEGEDWIAAMTPYEVGEQRLWVLTLAPAREFEPAWSLIGLTIAATLGILIGVAAVIAQRQARTIAAPLEMLAVQGKRIGALDFSRPPPLRTRIAELAQLSTTLDEMRTLLGRNQTALATQAGQLQLQVEELQTAEHRIHALAYFDPLTQLPNRRLLMDRLAHVLEAGRRRTSHCALLLLDLDNFKVLNDTLGHDHGDELLREVARRLSQAVRSGDTVARLGGDEFVVILEDLSEDPDEARQQVGEIGRKILQVIEHSYQVHKFNADISASIGAVLFGQEAGTAETALKHADMAMYQSKALGRNCLSFFGPELAVKLSARAGLEADLRHALEAGQIHLHYQAVVDVGGRLVGAEALMRWSHPERGQVPPAEFIPVAEESGLIIALGTWAIESACDQLLAWSATYPQHALQIAINVSARQFHHADFVATVTDILGARNIPGAWIKFELTESMLLEDTETVVERMQQLRALGIGFALDDFGTGYSSLSYLKRLPLTALKIDRSFVRDVLTDPNDAAIARTIIALAHTMELRVIAEGVELQAQFDMLAAAGCDRFQGYLIGRPEPGTVFGTRLEPRPPAA